MPDLKRTQSDVGDEENQVLTFVTPKISDEKWQEIETALNTILINAVVSRSELDNNLRIYNELYEGVVPTTKMFPWEGSANLHVPITQELLDGLHSRLAKAALGVVPLVLVKGQDIEDKQVTYRIERYYEALNHKAYIAEAINQAVFLALRDGVGLLKCMWDRRTRKVKSRKLKPLLDENQEPIMDPVSGKPETQEVVEIDDVVEYDDVRIFPVELKDFYLIPAHAYDMVQPYAKGVAERFWLRWDDLYQRGKSGMYRMDKVEAIKAASVSSRATQFGQTQATLGVDTVQGQVTLLAMEPEYVREYELFEITMNYDLDEDGYDEECIFTFAPRFATMLRAEVFQYWHQLRPYVPVIPWPRPRRFYGFSIPGRLESVNRELNAMHNQRLDAVTIRLSPPLLITRSAVLRGDASQPWGPSSRFEVDTKDDISPLSLPDINPSSFSEENILRQYGERIVGLYDINTPRGTGSRRTEAEISSIQQESMVRFDYMMKNIQRAIVRLFEQIHQLKLQYMPPEETFEAEGVGSEGVQQFSVSRKEMLANIRFYANGDLPVADKQAERQDAYFLYTSLMQNPLVLNRLDRVWSVTRDLLAAWERKNIEQVIGSLEEVQQVMQAQMQAQAAQPPVQPGQGGGLGGQTQPTGPIGPGGGTSLAGVPRRPAAGPRGA